MADLGAATVVTGECDAVDEQAEQQRAAAAAAAHEAQEAWAKKVVETYNLRTEAEWREKQDHRIYAILSAVLQAAGVDVDKADATANAIGKIDEANMIGGNPALTIPMKETIAQAAGLKAGIPGMHYSWMHSKISGELNRQRPDDESEGSDDDE